MHLFRSIAGMYSYTMTLLSDLRLGLRLAFKSFGSTLLAILVMAIGLGSSITMFSYVNGMIWSKPDFPGSDDLVAISWLRMEGQGNFSTQINPRDFRAFHEELESFDKLAAYQFQLQTLSNPDGTSFPERYASASVSSDFFTMVGVKPILGRLPDFEGIHPVGDPTLLISHTIWQEQYGGDREIIGKLAFLNGNPHTIIGVMPDGFHFPIQQELWTPSDWSFTDVHPRNRLPGLNVIGTLKPDVSVTQARVEMETIASRLAQEFPETNEFQVRLEIEPYGRDFIGDTSYRILLTLMVCAILVLLAACANVSNLIIARTSKRQFEFALKTAVGAHKRNIMMQVALDGLLLSLGGCIGGLILAYWGGKAIWGYIEATFFFKPYWWHNDFDARVLVFAIGLVAITALISSLAPALRAVGGDTIDYLKDSSRTSTGIFVGKVAKFLVGVQMAFSGALLVTALVMVFVVRYFTDQQYPYDPREILTARIQANQSAGLPSADSVYRFYQDMEEKLEAVPGISEVGFSFAFAGIFPGGREFQIEGEVYETPEDRTNAGSNIVTSSYFDVYGVKPLQGRLLNELDIDSTIPVCVVNSSFVEHYLPEGNPVGRRLRINSPGIAREVQNVNRGDPWTDWMTIVGVIPDLRPPPLPGQNSRQNAEMLIPHRQWLSRGMNLLLKGDGDVHNWIETTRRIMHEIAPQIAPVFGVMSVQDFLDRNFVNQRIAANIFTVFGIGALFMAIIGLYGMMSFNASQKMQEFGIRMALGGTGRDIVSLVYKQIVWWIAVGSLIGIGSGFAISNQLKNVMRVQEFPTGILAYPSVIIAITITSIIAVSIPALRAARNAPYQALRAD